MAEDAPSTQELRDRRDAAREREAVVSYRRRLVQAQLDLLAAGEDADLAAVLADRPGPGGPVRAVDVDPPPGAEDVTLEDLSGLDDDERAAAVERLAALERELSEERAELLAVVDGAQAQLVERYRDGGVDVGAMLAEGS